MTERLFDEAALESAAFDLWTSSTVSRYARMARRAAASNALGTRIWEGSMGSAAVIERATRLLHVVASQTERSLDEVELVLALASIERAAAMDVTRLLGEAANAASPAMVWVASFARDALGRRDANATVKTGFPRVRDGVPLRARAANERTNDFRRAS
ncbi:MAG: hypothetical protein U0234_03705 [Sandaracinus sp.]